MDRCGSLWVVVDRCGSFRVLVTTVKKGFVKGEGLRLLRTISSEETFVENIRLFKLRLRARGYPHNLIDKTLSEVKFSDRKKALKDNTRVQNKYCPL